MLTLALLTLALSDLLAEGQRAFQAGDWVRAEQAFRAYLKSAPRSAEATSNLAAVMARREQLDEAIRLYQRALQFDPRLTPVHFNLGVAQMKAGRFADCVASFTAFLKSHPGENRARQLRGLCMIESGQLPEGIAELEQLAPDPSIAFALATAHAKSGNEERATQLLAGLEQQPAQARLIEGVIEYRRGRFPEARTKFAEAVAIDASLGQAHAYLGRIAMLDNQEEDAARHLEQALARNPADAESTYQLGILRSRSGQESAARQLFERALSLQGNYADPLYQLAQLDFKARQYPAALHRLEKAVRILPEQEAIRLLLARTYQALGRSAEAQREFQEVRRLKAMRTKQKELPGAGPAQP